MSETEATVYNINKDYRIVRLKGNKCTLFFKNYKNKLLATLDGCNDVFTNISVSDEELSVLEKRYLLSFIKTKRYSITKDVADYLEVSIIKYSDGREEYLSEKMLKKKMAEGIDFAKVYVGKLVSNTLVIRDDSSNCSYDLTKSEISKVIVGSNCSVNIDLRDNLYIETLQIKEQFSGSVNLSRSNIESVFIANNCRCNLSISNAKKCFNLQIADVYSGNTNISNCCMYAVSLGYYSYADIVFTNNIIKKDIVIGDSFRGNLFVSDQNVDVIKIGNDCKGNVKNIGSSQYTGCKKVVIGDDFGGNLNFSNDECIKTVELGQKFCGKTEGCYARSLQKMKIGKYYSGNIDLTSSSIEKIYVDYGACGTLTVCNCPNLETIQTNKDNKLIIDSDRHKKGIKINENMVCYAFQMSSDCYPDMPFYKRVYKTIYNRLLG